MSFRKLPVILASKLEQLTVNFWAASGSFAVAETFVRKQALLLIQAALVAGTVLSSTVRSQTATEIPAAKPSRRVVARVMPEYPTLLKNSGIGGFVRVKLTVHANGTVTRATALGGNPVLAESSVKATMKWKFVPASSDTDEIVSLHFSPN